MAISLRSTDDETSADALHIDADAGLSSFRGKADLPDPLANVG